MTLIKSFIHTSTTDRGILTATKDNLSGIFDLQKIMYAIPCKYTFQCNIHICKDFQCLTRSQNNLVWGSLHFINPELYTIQNIAHQFWLKIKFIVDRDEMVRTNVPMFFRCVCVGGGEVSERKAVEYYWRCVDSYWLVKWNANVPVCIAGVFLTKQQ